MKEADQNAAVAHGAAERDFARRFERPVERKFLQTVAVVGQLLRLATIATVDQPTQFARLASAREMRGAVAEVEAWAHQRGGVCPTVLKRIPIRVFVKTLA